MAANTVTFVGRGEQNQATLYFIATYAVKGKFAYVLTSTTKLGSESLITPVHEAFVKSFHFK